MLLEGPPGTGKSTLLRAVASERAKQFHLVEGNAELTPARLVGHFDPAQVLAQGYTPEVFVDGPLVAALRDGGLLYVEEINRVPEETLNVLITVMSESELNVPRLGLVRAEDGFRLVAAMNPFDAVGTERISSAIYDRTCRISMDYQSASTRVGHRGAAVPGVRRRVAGAGRRPRPTYPGARGRAHRLVGARRDRPGRDRRAAHGDARRAAPTTGRPGSTPRWCRCRAGSGCTSPRDAGPRRSCASSTKRCSAPRPSDRDGSDPGEA